MMKTRAILLIVSVIVLSAGGCMRREGRNSDCRWPAESSKGPVSARHLSADAEFAEDLAIRYADTHFGPRSPNPSETYPDERDQCMGRLFGRIAEQHGVSVAQVSASLGRNRAYIDIAEILPFAVLFALTAIICTRWIWQRYAPEDGWTPGIVMVVFLSLVVAAGSTLLGEQWNWFVEAHRMGNNHMSYRAERLLWAQHRLELFAGAVISFWLAAIHTARRIRVREVAMDGNRGQFT